VDESLIAPELTVLYTHSLRGDLETLPRLYTFLRDLKARSEGSPVIVLDLGDSCDAMVWHCEVTGGRSMLIALDGMGYHAARVKRDLAALMRTKMGEMIRLQLVEDGSFYAHDGLYIAMTPDMATYLKRDVLTLARLEAGQIGMVQIRRQPQARVLSSTAHDVPHNAPPDPSISGVIEFIVSEARYAQKQREKKK
jgi:hypothetical protein